MSASYRWKPGAKVSLDAQIAGEELERLRIEHGGRLEPDDVVEVARSSNSPLHAAFEWDDVRAAAAHRLDQARYLIRSIEITVTEDVQLNAPVRAFVSVEERGAQRYTSVSDALTDPDLRPQVIARAWAELEAWRQRHAELIEFAKVFSAIDQARGAT